MITPLSFQLIRSKPIGKPNPQTAGQAAAANRFQLIRSKPIGKLYEEGGDSFAIFHVSN